MADADRALFKRGYIAVGSISTNIWRGFIRKIMVKSLAPAAPVLSCNLGLPEA